MNEMEAPTACIVAWTRSISARQSGDIRAWWIHSRHYAHAPNCIFFSGLLHDLVSSETIWRRSVGWQMSDELKRNGSCLFELLHYLGICMEGLRKTTETLIDERRFLNPDFNLRITNLRALPVCNLIWVTLLCYQFYTVLRWKVHIQAFYNVESGRWFQTCPKEYT
jgi:hypothetical protein